MTLYTIETAIKMAKGSQYWTVKAESEAEAIALFKSGGGDFDSEDIEVMDIEEPIIIDTEAIT